MYKKRLMIMGTSLLTLAGLLFSGYQGMAKEKVEFPKKPITFIIPMEPGSTMDSTGRPLAELMQKELGQPMMVLNKPGAAGTIGLRDVYGAKPDGYTIGTANTVHYAKLMGLVPYDHHDMTVIGIPSAVVPTVLCSAARPWKSVKELAEFAKNHSGEVKVATTSKGAYWWLATKAFERTADVKMNVLAQPGGGAMVVTQVAGGHVDVGVCGLPESRSQIQAGNLRLLAVFGRQRFPGYDQVPTLIESGYNTEVVAVLSLVAPKGLPKSIYDVLVQAFEKAVKNPTFHETMARMGAIAVGMTGDEAIKYMDEQTNVLRPLLKDADMIKSP